MQSPISSKHQCSVLSIITKNFFYRTFYYIPCRIWSTDVIKIIEPYCREKKYIFAFTENDFYNPAVLFIIHSDFYILTATTSFSYRFMSGSFKASFIFMVYSPPRKGNSPFHVYVS